MENVLLGGTLKHFVVMQMLFQVSFFFSIYFLKISKKVMNSGKLFALQVVFGGTLWAYFSIPVRKLVSPCTDVVYP